MTNLEKIRKMYVEKMAEFLQCVAICEISSRCESCKAKFVCNEMITSTYSIIRKLNEEANNESQID